MQRKYFDRRVVKSGSEIQIWFKSGGEWEVGVRFDDKKDQRGPYAGG